jgi:hypothetical protein
VDKYEILKKKSDLVITVDKYYTQRPEGNFVTITVRQIPFRDLDFMLRKKWAWIETPIKSKEFYEGGILFSFLDRFSTNLVKFNPIIGKIYWTIFPIIHPVRAFKQHPRIRHWMAIRRGKKWTRQKSSKK